MYKKLNVHLQEEVKDKVALFLNQTNHLKLKVHKLKGELEGRYSFSINYKIRIVFRYEDEHTATLLYVGSHDEVY
jgi:mRNA-degrading endonuclease YafQ of YafQ-DinJ toxin-antitoxin module